jgi:adenosylhomocysteine nucleosidase
MLGILVALPWELKTLTREKITARSWQALTPRTLVAVSGIGAASAGDAASLLIAQGATALLSWGYAAGLDDRLQSGALLLPERVIGVSGASYTVDREWHRRIYVAMASKLAVCLDALVESDAVVKTPAEKRALAERSGGAAADMESAAHARAAAERGMPFLAVRSIVDTSSTHIPESVLQAVDPESRVDGARLFFAACRAPADWGKLIRLALQFRAAQSSLKKAKPFVLDGSPF